MTKAIAGRGPVAGPGRMKGYRYVGSFDVHGELIVADRCYVEMTRPDLAHRFRAKRGVWHAWSQSSSGKYREVMLVIAAHERHLALATKGWHRTDDVPRVGADVPVESGNLGVVDAQRLDADEVFAAMVDDAYGTGEPEQLLDDLGAQPTRAEATASTHLASIPREASPWPSRSGSSSTTTMTTKRPRSSSRSRRSVRRASTGERRPRIVPEETGTRQGFTRRRFGRAIDNRPP